MEGDMMVRNFYKPIEIIGFVLAADSWHSYGMMECWSTGVLGSKIEH